MSKQKLDRRFKCNPLTQRNSIHSTQSAGDWSAYVLIGAHCTAIFSMCFESPQVILISRNMH